MLEAVGLREGWVAACEDEYVALAVAAAADLPKLARLRAGLRERMLASPLLDGPAFVDNLEGVYRRLWRRWLAGKGRGGAVLPGIVLAADKVGGGRDRRV